MMDELKYFVAGAITCHKGNCEGCPFDGLGLPGVCDQCPDEPDDDEGDE